jgi:hypothetical protein
VAITRRTTKATREAIAIMIIGNGICPFSLPLEDAAMLKNNRLIIWRWVKAKKLTGYSVGHFTLIPKEEVRKLLKLRTSEAIH